MHLGLHNIDTAATRVAAAAQVVNGCKASDYGIENSFGNLLTFLIEDGWGAHQMTNVAHEQQRAPRQGYWFTVAALVGAVRVQGTRECLPVLAHGFSQVALHQTQPVTVDGHLVIGIDRGH
ncbi:hypothetical protein D3C80_801500 [compost metagenome]